MVKKLHDTAAAPAVGQQQQRDAALVLQDAYLGPMCKYIKGYVYHQFKDFYITNTQELYHTERGVERTYPRGRGQTEGRELVVEAMANMERSSLEIKK